MKNKHQTLRKEFQTSFSCNPLISLLSLLSCNVYGHPCKKLVNALDVRACQCFKLCTRSLSPRGKSMRGITLCLSNCHMATSNKAYMQNYSHVMKLLPCFVPSFVINVCVFEHFWIGSSTLRFAHDVHNVIWLW